MIEIKGLASGQVEESRRRHGSNQITPQQTENFWDKLKKNLNDPTIKILVAALVIVMALAAFGFAEWYEGVGIAAAVALAALVSTASEYKNEQTFQRLQEEASKISVNVFRDGGLKSLNIDDIVVGDAVLLQAGDKIPADGRIVEGKVSVNQAALTGEPKPVRKTPGDADLSQLSDPHAVFRGTVVEDGEAVIVIEVVGDNTHLGKLAEALQTEDRPGPLRVKLAWLAHNIALFGYIAAPLIALVFMFKSVYLDNAGQMPAILAYFANWQKAVYDVAMALILAVVVIVVAVPEGLPMMIAIVLAQNMRKLLNSNVLVRQLMGVETSGSLNLLFTDKTGTITKGQLEAVGFLTIEPAADGAHLNHYTSFDKIPEPLAGLLDLSMRENTGCVVNCHAEKASDRILGGNSTERALLQFIRADVSECRHLKKEYVRTDQVLFNSERKFSGARIQKTDGSEITLIKGAPEKILELSKSFWSADREALPLTAADRTACLAAIDIKANEGFRLVAVATTESPLSETLSDLSNDLTLVGFGLIRDDLRPDSHETVKLLQGAGIQVVMITGDREGTARAIARDVGLLTSETDVVLKTEDMEKISDEELKQILPRLKAVSRCTPQDKVRLVRIAQEMGLVVGMTGDGVNDSPALSNADIGFGLGSGTEVAKEASDIVVLDDNIRSIASAVHYGRTIYRSIQKFITFQLSVSISAVSVSFIGPFLGFKLPFTMVQLLWVNLVMDTLAALSFSGEPPLIEHMRERPKRRDENIITGSMWSSILLNAFWMSVICITFLTSDSIRNLFHSEEAFLTGLFGMFVFLTNFNRFNVRVEDLRLFDHILENKGFLKIVGLTFLVQILATHFGGEIFRTVPLKIHEWFYVVLFSIVIIPFDLGRKYVLGRGKD
jgi:calcium-translocating P-type ATPase